MTPTRCPQDSTAQKRSSNSTICYHLHLNIGHHVRATVTSCAEAPSKVRRPREAGSERSGEPCTAPSTAQAVTRDGRWQFGDNNDDGSLARTGAMDARHMRHLRRHIAGTIGDWIAFGRRCVLSARVKQQSHQQLTLRAVA